MTRDADLRTGPGRIASSFLDSWSKRHDEFNSLYFFRISWHFRISLNNLNRIRVLLLEGASNLLDSIKIYLIIEPCLTLRLSFLCKHLGCIFRRYHWDCLHLDDADIRFSYKTLIHRSLIALPIRKAGKRISPWSSRCKGATGIRLPLCLFFYAFWRPLLGRRFENSVSFVFFLTRIYLRLPILDKAQAYIQSS